MKAFEIHAGLYSRLSGDVTLSGLVTGVFDEAPAGQGFPYVTIGSMTHAPDDLLNDRGEQSTATLHIWDRDTSFARIYQIMSRIDILLHGNKFTITGTQMVTCLRELADVMRDIDGETRRGVMRYRILTFGI